MKPAPFEYHRPASIQEAIETLADGRGKVLAGGQSLIPIMSMRLASPAALVDINHIHGLTAVDVGETAVRIGALVRHRQLEQDAAAYAAIPLLRRTLRHVSHQTIRNRGTTVGSLVHADPAAEMPAVLALLEGSVDVVSKQRGDRTISAAEFFVGPLESAVAADELAVAAEFPTPPAGTGSSWVELARRHGDYAMAGVGAIVTMDGDRTISRARVALISVGATPVVVDVSEACVGTTYDRVDWRGACELVDSQIEPEGDIHASSEYRRHLSRVLTRRALDAAVSDTREQVAA